MIVVIFKTLLKQTMHLYLQTENYAPWLAPYAYGIVLFGIVFFLFRVYENWYASKFNQPLFRNYWIYKRLSTSQKIILQDNFPFYAKLSKRDKRQFEHRTANFIANKDFVGRDALEITEEMTVLIAALGCMLSFGRRNYTYSLFDFVLVYPAGFYSALNDKYRLAEFNPREKAFVLSWKDFRESLELKSGIYLGIREFMLAMQLEAKLNRDIDSVRFNKQFQNILKLLTDQELKSKLEKSIYFRKGFTNQFEFMGILGEYFFDAPEEFQADFPQLYDSTKKLLNFNFVEYCK